MELHPFESMWRKYRKESGLQLERLEKIIHASLQKDEMELPPEIVLPRWMIESELKTLFKNTSYEDQEKAVIAMASLYQVLLTWRQDKAIYRVEPALYDCLKDARLPEKTPFACVKLPRRSLLLEILDRPYVFCYYDWIGLDDVADESSSELFLVMAEVTIKEPHPAIRVWNIDANCMDLNSYLIDRLENVSKNAPPHVADEEQYQSEMREFVGPILNILAYINGEDDIVKAIHPGQKPSNKIQNQEKLRRLQDLSDPELFNVGGKFASVLERWEKDREKDDPSQSHRSPRPHMRSAHSHLYWTGEGRKDPKVRFLPPIPVMGGISGEPEIPHVTVVK